ncbi:exodeoxyribonuclease I [Buchnera aphidicola (Ceratoglyphina bambusae)]|uniref:exodeoxyribonuclease I n=1 Tax=Buchnera aphidicola TaxID=9 RepID=UPI0031B85BC4
MLSKKFKFIFYDYETSGINPSLDKPLQFSCTITDYNFNILSKNICFFCTLPLDYLPNINSILINKIAPNSERKKNSLNEYYFSKNIYNIFSKKNLCIVGYNNLHFDDEFTRNIFYRNFLDPYSWHYKNNNSRLDVLTILRAYYSFRPDNIKWPKNIKNDLVSFKLSDFTRINNIFHNKPHDAVFDVLATISVIKFLKKKNSKLFNYIFKNRFKKNVLKIIYKNINKPIFYSSNIFGIKRFNLSTVFFLFIHPKNFNIAIMFDLSKSLKVFFYYFNKEYETNMNNISIQSLFHLGIIFIHLNKCPILAPISVARRIDFNRIRVNFKKNTRRILYIKKNWDIFLKLKKFFLFIYEYKIETSNVDLKIYNNFIDYHDKKLLSLIHNTQPNCFNKLNLNFNDNRMKELLFRLKARNFPSLLNKIEKKKWKKHCLKYFNISKINKYKFDLKNMLIKNKKNYEKVFLLKQTCIYLKNIISLIIKY